MKQLYISLEISTKGWKLCFCGGSRKRFYTNMHPTDFKSLPELVNHAKHRLGLDPSVPVITCHEAGLQGFWIHRFLESCGYQSLVVDPASIEVSRRRRRVKTDRIDVKKLMNMLLRHGLGEDGMWSVLRVPDEQVEDHRRLHRELKRLKNEETQHRNRILGLLRLHGPIFVKVNKSFLARLENIITWQGTPIPCMAKAEIEREYERLVLVWEQQHKITLQMRQLAQEDNIHAVKVRTLQKLVGIGLLGAWTLVYELYWRDFKNRKEVGSYTGLTGTPYASGSSQRDQGISKAGNARIRALLNQLSWTWVRLQPSSRLTLWFRLKCLHSSKRFKRVAITGMSRKMAVALWYLLENDIVPSGARLKDAS